jgi:hypothetical protein
MYGAMYVTEAPMPALSVDTNIPPSRRTEIAKNNSGDAQGGHAALESKPWHPYHPVAPYLYRIFMPDASPAAVAVHLPGQLSYCWDAGTCHLRYAWQGGFLANLDHWKDKGDTFGKPAGAVFYRDKTTYPLRIDKSEHIPVAVYKGYRLIDRFPEFHYTLNGMDVYELIKPAESGTGLVRTFRIPEANKTVWFVFHPEDGVIYKPSAGKLEKDRLKLSPRQARHFSIRMEKKEGTQL